MKLEQDKWVLANYISDLNLFGEHIANRILKATLKQHNSLNRFDSFCDAGHHTRKEGMPYDRHKQDI